MESFDNSEEHLNDLDLCLSHLGIRNDPWGVCDQKISENSIDCNMFFEDSFRPNFDQLYLQRKETTYKPLDDSQQYLEGLQKKLARIQGKTKSTRENEMKKMINDIALSRADHTSNFMNSDSHEGYLIEEQCDEDVKISSLNTIDPQGTLGVMMRKLAPEHVALSEEELYELLKRDALAKAYSQLQEDESEDSDTTGSNNKVNSASGENKENCSEDQKEKSSS